jgi:Bacterial Ig-like domain (group 3)
MLFSNWPSSLKYHLLLRGNARARRGRRRARSTPELMQLEDLCLLSTFVPTLPTNPTTGLPMGTMQSQGLGSVVYTFPQDPNNPSPNLPAAKLITIMNNSSDVIFPILYGSNSTADETAGQVVRVEASGGTGYTGTFNVTFSNSHGGTAATAVIAGNNNIFGVQSFTAGSGYQPGDQVTVQTITPIGTSIVGTGATIQAFTSQVTPGDKKALYDPQDPINETYRGYIGEYINGQYELGLQPGHQVTVQVPIAFWDGGRQFMVDNGPVPLTSQFDPGYPLQANAEWSYNPSATPNALAGLGAGLSYIVYPTASNPMPLYGADFKDPNTGYANPNGVVMWYHEVTAEEPHVFPDNLPAVITETTFRDPLQTVIAPDMPPSQTLLIDNYDVSYVDTLGLPASMEATLVPSAPATPGSGQYAWTGADQSTTDMQQSVANFTTNNTSVNTDPNGVSGLGTYFNGLGWDQFYLPPDNDTTAADSIKRINNAIAATPVTIITQNSTAGLQNGSAIKIVGVTGQTNINGTWVISNLTSTSFALVGSLSEPSPNPSSGGTWTAVQTTGIDVQKLAAGSDATALSPNVDSPSPFDSTKFNLVSGGTVYNVDTTSTGLATMGQTTITGVLAAQALQMVVGMLWSPTNNAAGTQLFPTGTTIVSIAPDGSGMGTYAITMSAPATATGSPGKAGVGGSFAFVGSLYTSATTPTGQPSMTPGSIPMNSNIMTIDPNIGMYLRPGMMVTGSQIPAGTYIAATPGSISADFTKITLTQSIGGTASSGPYNFVGAPDSYVLQTLINNWYAWADYYVTQLASGPNAAPSGTFQATTTTYTNIYTVGSTDLSALTLTNIPLTFDMNQLRVGDVVTAATAGTLNANLTGSPAGTPGTPGYDPSLNYTIVTFDASKRTVELSLPVAVKNATTDTFTFAPPQYVVRSSDAPAANPTSITGIDTSAGQMYTISSGNVSGLVSGQTQVTISGVIDQTTELPAAINGQYIVVNVNTTNNTFQLQGTSATGTESFIGGTGIWSTSAGTIPYSLNFNVPSTAITGISNPNGQAITITTGSTVGLTPGEQITINGVTGGSQNINGTWTVINIKANTFVLAGLTGAVAGQGGPTGKGGMAPSGGTWTPANNLQFAQTVYDVMQTFSLLKDPSKLASRSALLLSYIMGGNTGAFVQNNDPSRQTTLPDFRTANQLRNELKSLLRGVYDFNAIPDQSQWYPNPATPTPDATLNGSTITFGIQNLDPYVWFVHRVLNNSSYGFSFDDDVANAQAASSSLEIAVGGNAYTAPPPAAPFNGPNVLPNPEGFSPFAQWGTQQSQGYIDTTTQTAKDNLAAGLTTIAGLDQSAVARLTASNPTQDTPGAFITSNIGVPAGVTVTVVNTTALPQVSAAITGITNSTNTPGTITITITTANTQNLAPGVSLADGQLVTITGVTRMTNINKSWIVTNVTPTSFDLVGSTFDASLSGGAWTLTPSSVTFQTPANWTAPTDNATHTFTFSIFNGTTVPTNITGPTAALPGAVITINGKGLTGVFGVSFNGYPGTIVGSSIASITNTIGSPLIINLPAGTFANGLSDGDTVTISGVKDLTTGKPAAVNGTWTVAYSATLTGFPNAFQLTGNGSIGNGDALSGGSWIDGTDVAVKVIVPDTKSNATLPNGNTPTNPGPTGKIGVRNASGIAYSTADFTITPTLTLAPPPAPVSSAVVLVGPTSAFAGEPVTLTANVTSEVPGDPIGQGVVTFMDGATALGTVAESAGIASLQVQLPAGHHTITAVYQGDATHSGSTSAALTVDVGHLVVSGSKLEAVNPDGTRAFTVQPYGKTARAGFNVAVGEVAADGGADVFVAPKKGRRGRVKVINGRTGAIVRSFFASGRRYSGGVALAAADLIGDGNAEIIAGRATGQRSVIKVFDSANGQVLQRIVAFRRVRHHGLSLSVREVNGGAPEIVASSRGPRGTLVEVFDGRTGAPVGGIQKLPADPAKSFAGKASRR